MVLHLCGTKQGKETESYAITQRNLYEGGSIKNILVRKNRNSDLSLSWRRFYRRFLRICKLERK